MTWRVFIDTIDQSQIISGMKPDILINLFRRARCKNDLSISTANSWIYGRRNCNSSRYFPDGEVDCEGVFRFFRNRSERKLKDLQQIFQKEADFDSPIEVKTDNMDTFCWSLVNQFLDLLGLQRVDIPPTEPPRDEAVGASQSPDGQRAAAEPEDSIPERDEEQLEENMFPSKGPTCDLPPDGGTEVPSEDTEPQSELIEISRGDADILNKEKHSIRPRFLPHSDSNCCYHCAYWDGDRKTFGGYTTATYGVCIKHNRSKQLSTGPTCKDYEKRIKQSGDW